MYVATYVRMYSYIQLQTFIYIAMCMYMCILYIYIIIYVPKHVQGHHLLHVFQIIRGHYSKVATK